MFLCNTGVLHSTCLYPRFTFHPLRMVEIMKTYSDYLADGFVLIGESFWWILTRVILSPIALLGWLNIDSTVELEDGETIYIDIEES